MSCITFGSDKQRLRAIKRDEWLIDYDDIEDYVGPFPSELSVVIEGHRFVGLPTFKSLLYIVKGKIKDLGNRYEDLDVVLHVNLDVFRTRPSPFRITQPQPVQLLLSVNDFLKLGGKHLEGIMVLHEILALFSNLLDMDKIREGLQALFRISTDIKEMIVTGTKKEIVIDVNPFMISVNIEVVTARNLAYYVKEKERFMKAIKSIQSLTTLLGVVGIYRGLIMFHSQLNMVQKLVLT